MRTFCSFPFNKIKVNCDGGVHLCCRMKSGSIGNLRTSSFEEIWNSPLLQEIRTSCSKGELHKTCSAMGTCPYIFKEREMYEIKEGYPKILEIDLPNTSCNIGAEIPTKENPGCIMCNRANANFRPQEDHLDEIMPKLKSLMPYIRELHVQGIAEPFYKERVFDMMDKLNFKIYSKNCKYVTYTNGTLFNSRIRNRLYEYCNKCIIKFSLDASTPETYRKIRRIDAFDKVVEYLMAYSKERTKHQKLHINNNINYFNVHEVVGMVEMASKAQVDALVLNSTFSLFEETLDGIKTADFMVNSERAPLFKKAQEDALKRAEELGVNLEINRPLHHNLIGIDVYEIS